MHDYYLKKINFTKKKLRDEWTLVESYFDAIPTSDNSVQKLHRASSRYHTSQDPKTVRSYLRFGHTIFQLYPGEKTLGGAIAGEGSTSRVKYLYNKSGQRFTCKIDNRNGMNDDPEFRDYETDISLDLGFFKFAGLRRKKTLLSIMDCRYAVMNDLGEQLSSYLAKNDAMLSDQTRLDMAFQACFQVYKLHQGWLSKSGRPVAHLDIKPSNFFYDEKKKKISLGDYGSAEYDTLDANPKVAKGTPNYLPYVTDDPESNLELLDWTNKSLDIFALMRTCYCPLKRVVMGDILDNTDNLPPMILSNDIISTHHLAPYFDTQLNNHPLHDALFLGVICLLSKINKSDTIPHIVNNKTLQHAIVVLYYADALDEEHLDAIFEKSTYADFLSKQINSLDNLPEADIRDISYPEAQDNNTGKEEDLLRQYSFKYP